MTVTLSFDTYTGIHMSPIPIMSYVKLYGERIIRSVTKNTRQDTTAFLEEATKCGIKTHVNVFLFKEVNETLIVLKHENFQGSGVISIKSS